MFSIRQFKTSLISLALIFCYVISVQSAVVSDSDGSAFITKAEFESLKNNFNSQIETYNSSIDNKIDGAIASYLSGVNLDVEPIVLLEKYKKLVGSNPTFLNQLPGTGKSVNKGQISISVLREEAVNKYTNLNFKTSLWTNGSDWVTADSCLYFGSDPDWNGSYASWTNVWLRRQSSLFTGASAEPMDGALSSYSYWSSGTSKTNAISAYQAISDKVVDGDGEAYVYQNIGGGNAIKFYDTTIFPNMKIDCIAHRYLNCASLTTSYYTNSTGKSDTTSIVLNLNKNSTYGKFTQGSQVDSKSTSNATYASTEISKQEVSDGKNYMNYIFAKNTNQNVYCIDEDASIVADSSTTGINTDTTYWYDLYYTGAGGKTQTNSMSGITLNYYALKYTVEQKKVNSFYNYYISNIAGEKVYNGEGLPIIRAQSPDTSCTVKITFNSSSGKIGYKVSEKKFIDGEFDTSADLKASGEVDSGTEVSVNVDGLKKDQHVWVNCYSVTNGATANISNVTCTMR